MMYLKAVRLLGAQDLRHQGIEFQFYTIFPFLSQRSFHKSQSKPLSISRITKGRITSPYSYVLNAPRTRSVSSATCQMKFAFSRKLLVIEYISLGKVNYEIIVRIVEAKGTCNLSIMETK